MVNIHPFINIPRKKKCTVLFFLPAVLLLMGCHNQERTWSVYKADAQSSSYSVLKEINKENVHQLKLAWTFNPDDAAEGSRFAASQCNPIIIDGVMYAASARHRIYAINAGNGKQIWSFDPFNGGAGGGSFRGVTYWEDGNDKRILFTGGDNLFALNARDGKTNSCIWEKRKSKYECWDKR